MCSVQELDLSIPMKHSTRVLPRDLCSSRTLVVLKLGTQFVMNVPSLVCLPSLKVLHLDTVKLSGDDSIKRLLLGFPVLEELSKSQCVGEDVYVIDIFAPVLIKLTINFLPYDLDSTDFYQYKIVLNTSSLLHLEFDDFVAEGYLIKDPCHLIKAGINISTPTNMALHHFDPIHSEAITELLVATSKVQHLCSGGFGMEAIHLCNTQLPMFHNVTYLEFGALEDFVRREVLPQLLKNSPHLGTLGFKEGLREEDDQTGCHLHCYPPPNVPTCLLFHLKVIETYWFQGNEAKLEMLEYFLKNGLVLKKLMVHIDPSEKVDEEVTDKLLRLPRGSGICQVELLQPLMEEDISCWSDHLSV